MKPDKLFCYVFDSIFGLDRAQTTEHKTKDCERVRPNINWSTIVFMPRFYNQSLN